MSPEFASLNRQGEEAILQNASATGGLRGGNIQGGLANFRSDLLSNLITNKTNQYSALSGGGQSTGVQLGQFGANNAQVIGGLLQNIGSAQAGGVLGVQNAKRQGFQDFLQIAGAVAGF